MDFTVSGEMKEADWLRMEFPKAEVLIINFSASEFFLPPFIDRMPNLRALILINYGASYASIHNFHVFEKLASLRSLWLEKVTIPQFSDFPLISLRKLFVVLCKINDNVDGGMTDLSEVFPNLSELTLDHCDNLKELSPSICRMQSLQNLSLTNCHNLVQLPDELGKLRYLEILRLYACPALQALPPSIGELSKLKYIDISQCVNLVRIPAEIGKLVHLEKIDMRECSSIRRVPESATSLKSLRLVICDEDVSGMWRDVEKAKPDVCVQVSEQCYDLDWLNEK